LRTELQIAEEIKPNFFKVACIEMCLILPRTGHLHPAHCIVDELQIWSEII
jgi:hypothetical protein